MEDHLVRYHLPVNAKEAIRVKVRFIDSLICIMCASADVSLAGGQLIGLSLCPVCASRPLPSAAPV